MSYDETYSTTRHNFGEAPERILTDYSHRMNVTQPVLDIGAGQGRNALFLAREGFTVDAIDPSRVATETIAALAAEEHLPIRATQSGFAAFVPHTEFYAGILVFGLIQILTWEEIDLLREKLRQWTRPGSLIFITGFTVADSSYVRYAQQWESIGVNSFGDGQGDVRTYLEAGQILDLFADYRVVHHWAGLGPEHRHGDGPLERHALIEAVFQR